MEDGSKIVEMIGPAGRVCVEKRFVDHYQSQGYKMVIAPKIEPAPLTK